ncbi:hypothetical protein HPB48_025590 [Haemaphysalis longicornis]|uniref:Uncharacterized protein n=1 Tax=Haemaphysalis longicornis TaxID=44386 RepID=A0A9J6H965_HAELO|nr:hypothetical protein HPB48_025590 [Haemaphysalis longicornis]
MYCLTRRRKGKHGKKQQQHENGWTSERSEQGRQQEQQQQNENQQAGQEGKQEAEVKFTKGKQHKGKPGNKDAMADSKGYKQQKQKEKLNKDQAAAQEKQQSKYAKKADKGKQTKEPKVQKEEAQQQQGDKGAAEHQPEPAQYYKQDQAQRPVEQSQPVAKDLCADSRTHQAAPSSTKCQTEAQQAPATQAAAPAMAGRPACPQSKTSLGHGCIQSCACPDAAVCFAATGNARGVCKLPEPDDLTRGSYLP